MFIRAKIFIRGIHWILFICDVSNTDIKGTMF